MFRPAIAEAIPMRGSLQAPSPCLHFLLLCAAYLSLCDRYLPFLLSPTHTLSLGISHHERLTLNFDWPCISLIARPRRNSAFGY